MLSTTKNRKAIERKLMNGLEREGKLRTHKPIGSEGKEQKHQKEEARLHGGQVRWLGAADGNVQYGVEHAEEAHILD